MSPVFFKPCTINSELYISSEYYFPTQRTSQMIIYLYLHYKY